MKTDIAKERFLFEENWPNRDFSRDLRGDYVDPFTQRLWCGWKAKAVSMDVLEPVTLTDEEIVEAVGVWPIDGAAGENMMRAIRKSIAALREKESGK